GSLLNAWDTFLRRWLGWSAILVPVTLGWLAWLQLAANVRGEALPVRWWRVIAGQAAFIAGRGLLNIAIGKDIAAAASGQGGGLIGWSIGYFRALLLPPPTDLLLLLALFLSGLFLATDVTADRLGRVLDWLQSFGFDGDAEANDEPAARPARPVAAAP